MKIAIVDDLKSDRKNLRELLCRYFENRKSEAEIQEFESAEQFLERFTAENFQLVLLDIYMSGMNGMATAQYLRDMGAECDLIFITGCDSYAVSSYDVQASCYLLKPVQPEKLEKALDKCLKTHTKDSAYIDVRSDRFSTRVMLRSIIYADTFQNAIHLHTDAGVLKTYMTFSEFSKLLAEDSRFLFCYKGYLVNMDRIAKISDDCFVLKNGHQIPIRKRGSSNIKKTYFQYLLSDRANRH